MDGLRLGRVAGFAVSAHWTVVGIVLLLTWGLASGLLPRAAPGRSPLVYWSLGALAALLLLGSLLAHELGHAIVARRSGMRVKGITLWLFGGVATLVDEAPDPRTELRVAVVGPVVSLAISATFGLLAAALRAVGGDPVLVAVAAWLAAVNLLLGMFNLVPGAPLDGGRVLRALIWRRHGDRDRATVTAARAGQGVGYGLVIVGLLAFVYGDTVDGVWFVLIGWFLMSAARQEGELGATDQLLRGVTVGDVMSAPVDAGDAETTVRDFIEHRVLARKHSAYPVTNADGTVVGLVTLAQLRTVPQSARDTVVVRDVALPTEHVAVAAPGDALTALLPRLTRESGGRALVIEDGRLRGIVTPTDVARVVELRQLVRPD